MTTTIASEISKVGLDVLKDKSDEERTWFAADWFCPTDDEYFRRFKEAMGTHAGAEEVDRYYAAQCLKDETMAESIARAWDAAAAAKPGTRPVVVHYNGAFHSDYGLGTVARVARRLPQARISVVSVIPGVNLDEIDTTDHLHKGEFLLFTIK